MNYNHNEYEDETFIIVFFDFWGNILRFPRMILYLWDLNSFYYEKDFICVYGDVLLYSL